MHPFQWEPHINYDTADGNETLKLLRRHLATWEAKLITHSTLIRHKLEYVSLTCNPHQSYLIDNLEAIQSKATRFILHNYAHTSIFSLKKQIIIHFLADRRKVSRLAALRHIYYRSPSKKDIYCRASMHIFSRTGNSHADFTSLCFRTKIFRFSSVQLSLSFRVKFTTG